MAIWTDFKKAGYCYVIGYESSLIKIGRTAHPQSRIWSHLYDAKRNNKPISCIYMTDILKDCHKVEVSMLELVSVSSVRISLEIFSGISFDKVLALLKRNGFNMSEIVDIFESTIVPSLKGKEVFLGNGPISTETENKKHLFFDGEKIFERAEIKITNKYK